MSHDTSDFSQLTDRNTWWERERGWRSMITAIIYLSIHFGWLIITSNKEILVLPFFLGSSVHVMSHSEQRQANNQHFVHCDFTTEYTHKKKRKKKKSFLNPNMCWIDQAIHKNLVLCVNRSLEINHQWWTKVQRFGFVLSTYHIHNFIYTKKEAWFGFMSSKHTNHQEVILHTQTQSRA